MRTDKAKESSRERGDADDRASLLQLIRAMSITKYSSASPILRKLLLRLLQTPRVDYQKLARVSVSALKCDSHIKDLLEIDQKGQAQTLSDWIETDQFRQGIGDPLICSVLLNIVIKDLELERLFTKLRESYLDLLMNHAPGVHLGPHINFMEALACQCFKNEYIYAVTSREEELLDRMAQRIALLVPTADPMVCSVELEQMLAAYGMYRPLWSVIGAQKPFESSLDLCSPSFSRLIREQVEDYFEEQLIKKDIPSLGISDSQVSRAVREQYEESPYPRWFNITVKEPQRFTGFIESKFPHLSDLDRDDGVTKILVAGCGTGRHALSVASKYQDSSVLAVDISKASLAYAIRKAREFDIRNIEFCHSDILRLPKLSQRFQVIEAVGVLHHMEKPAAAWKILSELLVPGGFMRLGIYSRRGRAFLAPTKRFVSERMVGNQLDTLRTIRQEIIAMKNNPEVQAAVASDDFFVFSEFRDLICHTHETHFTLGEIANMIKELGLKFVGFEFIAQDAQELYQRLFPGSHQFLDLELWDKFENEQPAAFGSMYRFWVRKMSQPASGTLLDELKGDSFEKATVA